MAKPKPTFKSSGRSMSPFKAWFYSRKFYWLKGIPDFGRWDSSSSEEPLPELIAKDELFHDEPYYTWNPAEKALASQYLPATLECLTARQREAFKMKYEEGMTVTAIAKQLGRSR